MRNCKNCKSDFEPKSKKAEFCSDKCRVYFGRKEAANLKKAIKSMYYVKPVILDKLLDYDPFKEKVTETISVDGVLKTNDPEVIKALDVCGMNEINRTPKEDKIESLKPQILFAPKWAVEIEEICNEQGILPEDLVKQWKEMWDFPPKEGVSKSKPSGFKDFGIFKEKEENRSTTGLSKWQLELRKKKLGI